MNMSRYCQVKPLLRLIKEDQHCEQCATRQLCLKAWLDNEARNDIGQITLSRGTFHKGQAIYKLEDRFRSLFIVQTGSVKVEKTLEDGTNHVNSFYFRGDLLGLDAIGNTFYNYDAVSLETTRVCKIPYEHLEILGSSFPRLQQRIISLISSKIYESNNLLLNSRYLSADKRLLLFIKSLCDRNLVHSKSGNGRVHLPMSKGDIASYLGMRAESLSRILADLQKQGILCNRSRYIEINDINSDMWVICK